MFRRAAAVLFVFILAFSLVSSAAAQSYSFRVEKEVANVFWNADGTMALDYVFTFLNDSGGHVIDFVDVGLPNDNYDYNSITADVDGDPVSISKDYQGSGSGVAVDMGPHAIQPGQRGNVHVHVGRVSNVLYKDDKDPAYASAVFAPNYFGSGASGPTDLTVTFHLPPGVKSQEPRWHSAPSGFPSEPQTALDSEGRITYTWNNPSARPDRAYEFGASFPLTYVPAPAIQSAPPVSLPGPSINFGAIFNVLCVLLFFGIPTVVALTQGQRRKMDYMPPRIAIEGHGIKRGLTAVEAAVLMGQPLDKVLTMILFSVVKKNAARVVSKDPLQIEAVDPLPADLREYEGDFLKAFKAANDQARQQALRDTMVDLVEQVSGKMRGFSRQETVDYYRSIMERAWQQVEEAGTPEVKSQKMDEAMEWTMLDRDYSGRMQRTFPGPIYVPTWWGRYDPMWGGGGMPVSTAGAPKTAAPAIPSMPSSGGSRALPGADFAASVVGGVQSFSSRVVGNINTFTNQVARATNPPPPPAVSSSSRGGGGWKGGGSGPSCVCACACACAGCACACAGGGR